MQDPFGDDEHAADADVEEAGPSNRPAASPKKAVKRSAEGAFAKKGKELQKGRRRQTSESVPLGFGLAMQHAA